LRAAPSRKVQSSWRNFRQRRAAASETVKRVKAQRQLWVKLRRTQCEHIFSALPSNSDIARCGQHVSDGPAAVILECRNQQRINRLRLVPARTDHNEKQRKLSGGSPDDAHAGQNILDGREHRVVRFGSLPDVANIKFAPLARWRAHGGRSPAPCGARSGDNCRSARPNRYRCRGRRSSTRRHFQAASG
jgi:hypothetical protein